MLSMTEEALKRNAEMCGIPERMVGALVRYVAHGLQPGDFLTAVITNDLFEACGRADDENRYLLFNYCKFFYNYAPSQCFGSKEKMQRWGHEPHA